MKQLTASQARVYRMFLSGVPATPGRDPLREAFRRGLDGGEAGCGEGSMAMAAYLAGAELRGRDERGREMITVTREGERFIARFPFSWETKDVVKAAGFRWSPTERLWHTSDPLVAARLDPRLAAEAARQANETIAASRATGADVSVPAPTGLSYLPYQLAGIDFMRQRDSTLLADQMGLGKTIQIIGLINSDPSLKKILVVCPASIKTNWTRELNKWLVKPRSIGIAGPEWPAGCDVVVINYDVLRKFRSQIDRISWDLMAVDECHMAKNAKAQRTQALLGRPDRDASKRVEPIRARRRVFMTGTPIVNRPAELWTLVRALDPRDLGSNFFRFHQRYTNAHHNGWGWDFSGASNLEELQTKLRSKFMIRRLKDDVLAELPPKRRQVIAVGANGASSAVERERQVFEKIWGKGGYAEAVDELRAKIVDFSEMSEVRRATAVAKIPHVVEHLAECLEAEEKVVVFVHHHDVAHALAEAFPGSAVVTGETPVKLRMDQVDRFQHDPSCRLFIGSIGAAGVGLTLTAAQLVVFAELDWVPGNVSQAEDRLHRIGQAGSVLVQHLVFDGSVDAYMAQMIIAKQEVIETALDRPIAPVEVPKAVAAPAVSRPQAARLASGMTETASATEIPDDEEIPF